MAEQPTFGAEAQVIYRALRDPDFRAKLLADPNAAVEETLGCTLAAGTKVVVHQMEPNTVHLSLPIPPENPAELTDAELRRMADNSSSDYTSHFYTGPACSC